jgi:hypothetical protein
MSDKKKTEKKKATAAKPKKAAPKKPQPKAKTKPYKKNGKWFSAKGKEITHKGTINLLENKNTFKPGVSGNPKGYPKGVKNRSTVLRELLDLELRDKKGKYVANPFDKKEKKITVEKAIMAGLVKKAIGGDVAAAREIQDTVYGKLKDRAVIDVRPTVVRDDI